MPLGGNRDQEMLPYHLSSYDSSFGCARTLRNILDVPTRQILENELGEDVQTLTERYRRAA